MGLFDRFKKNKTIENNGKGEEEIFMANISVYSNNKGDTFGALVLTEGVLTGLPLDPKSTYRNNGETIEVWKLLLFSITLDKPVGEIDYYNALEKLKKYSIGEKDGRSIIRPLTLEEQLGLLEDGCK